jgi:hypothetical protein
MVQAKSPAHKPFSLNICCFSNTSTPQHIAHDRPPQAWQLAAGVLDDAVADQALLLACNQQQTTINTVH